MGGKLVLPEPDAITSKVITTFLMSPQDIAKFLQYFQKLDKNKTGLVPLQVIFKAIECKRDFLSDALLELLEIEHEGELNFSDFLYMVCSYCLFEPPEILKFCFYLFDQDKQGYFESDDLKALMNSLHGVIAPKIVQGNVKVSWQLLHIPNDDRIDFKDFSKIHNSFPRLFQPAFRLQYQMRTLINGEVWWDLKREEIAKDKERKQEEEKKEKALAEASILKERERRVKRKMGLLFYFCCPCFRYMFRPDYKPTETDAERLAREKREKEMREHRRAEDLRVKNPETAAWKTFQKKADPTQGGEEGYIEEKLEKVERKRANRAVSRAERREERKRNPDLKPAHIPIKPLNEL